MIASISFINKIGFSAQEQVLLMKEILAIMQTQMGFVKIQKLNLILFRLKTKNSNYFYFHNFLFQNFLLLFVGNNVINHL